MSNTQNLLETIWRKNCVKKNQIIEELEQISQKREPMRAPRDDFLVWHIKTPCWRCNGKKPKYKNVRRGFGRPTIDIFLF